MKYFFSILAIIVGFLLTKYSNKIVDSFGYMEWAEHYLGSYGGSRLMWKIIGILFIVGSLLVISGLMEKLLTAIFAPMTRGLSY